MPTLDAAFWFEIADETRPVSDIPEDVAATVLQFLNQATTPQDIAYAVPLLDGWTEEPVHSKQILESRGAGFESLNQLWAVPRLGPARFTEVIRSIAKTDEASVPGFMDAATSFPVDSSSDTELKFEYELLLPGPLQGKRGVYPRQDVLPEDDGGGGDGGGGGGVLAYGSRCCVSASSCLIVSPSFNMELNRYESQVQITGLVLYGENEDTRISIRMDHRLRPYDWIQPINTAADGFEFPAIMQLNNSMMLDLEIKATGQRFSLVARDVPCQVGRTVNWPPHHTLLYSTEPLDYYDAHDPTGDPVVRIHDATTFLRGPENFFSRRTKITAYEFVPPEKARGLPMVTLHFDAELGGAPVKINHYLVYRSQDPNQGEGSWSNVSGPVLEDQWTDANPPPGPLYYRIVPVQLDVFGVPYEGFPGPVQRVEPATSIFR